MSIASQDVFLNLTTPISVVGSGGVPTPPNPDPQFSTVTAAGLVGISSINGSAYTPGSLPASAVFQSVSTQVLLVSSINGAPVGGGVTPNLTVSSITAANSISSLGTLSVGGNMNLNSGSILGFGSTFMTASVGGTVMNMSAPNGRISMISPSTVISATGNAPSQVVMPGNLQVSSINGATPAADPIRLPGYYVGLSSFSTTDGQFVPFGYAYNNISTTVGRTYRLDMPVRITPTQPSVNPATIPLDNSMVVAVSSGPITYYSDAIPTIDIYNISRGPLSSFNATYSIPFTAQSAQSQVFIVYNNNNASAPFNFTNTTVISSFSAGALLTDLGLV